MSAISIVQVNVSVQVAPTPATLQQSGAFISQGGTDLSPSTYAMITQPSDLVPLLPAPAALSAITWSANVVTVTASASHNLPVGQTMLLTISGVTPTGYNGTYPCTITSTTQFTYPLATNPGSETVLGTWTNYSATELTQMVTTYFAQGKGKAVFVLELGASDVTHGVAALSAYLIANPNRSYVPGAMGYFYSYLVPREWDSNASFLTLMQSYESPTARTYFFITTTLQNYINYTNLMKCADCMIESPVIDIFPANALTAISYSSGTGYVTATTTTAHGVAPGSYFTIAGCTPSGYNGTYLALTGTQSTTIIYAVKANPGSETILGTLQASLYANAGVTSAEFSHASDFCVALAYAPSTTNRVTPFAFSYLYGVTPFPIQGFNSLVTTLQTANISIVGTGAEGGISQTALFKGHTMDGNPFNYWYSADWMQINLDVATSNAVINGSNNPINPLYYNQPGINVLQSVAASVCNQGIIYGLVLGNVVLTALDGPVLDANLDAGDYADQTVINAVPFVTYSIENPSDYATATYSGLAVIYMPQQGFEHINYNLVITELIAQ